MNLYTYTLIGAAVHIGCISTLLLVVAQTWTNRIRSSSQRNQRNNQHPLRSCNKIRTSNGHLLQINTTLYYIFYCKSVFLNVNPHKISRIFHLDAVFIWNSFHGEKKSEQFAGTMCFLLRLISKFLLVLSKS